MAGSRVGVGTQAASEMRGLLVNRRVRLECDNLDDGP
jgi:hypothetical protein